MGAFSAGERRQEAEKQSGSDWSKRDARNELFVCLLAVDALVHMHAASRLLEMMHMCISDLMPASQEIPASRGTDGEIRDFGAQAFVWVIGSRMML